MTVSNQEIQACLLRLVEKRGPAKSICPSEVARALKSDNWRSLMPQVRAVGTTLAKAGEIVVTQKGAVIDPAASKGPIRYRLSGNQ
ncbi:MAG: DUF3253 domain-containing protein [Cyanobacteria bacterium P01_C01_bin.120]